MKTIIPQADEAIYTTDYSVFELSTGNRVIKRFRVERIKASMRQRGFRKRFAIHVIRRGEKLVIKEGQGRFIAAQELGIGIYYIIYEDDGIDSAESQGTAWTLIDYIQSWAAKGNSDYALLLSQERYYGIAPRQAAAMMTGSSAEYPHIANKLRDGTFQCTNIELVHAVGEMALATSKHVAWAKVGFYIAALSRCARVKGFDFARYIERLNKYPGLLQKQPSIDGFVAMIDKLYNHHMRAAVQLPIALLVKQAGKQRKQ